MRNNRNKTIGGILKYGTSWKPFKSMPSVCNGKGLEILMPVSIPVFLARKLRISSGTRGFREMDIKDCHQMKMKTKNIVSRTCPLVIDTYWRNPYNRKRIIWICWLIGRLIANKLCNKSFRIWYSLREDLR